MADKKYAIGVDLGGTSIKLGLVSNTGDIVFKECVDTLADQGPDKVISQIKKGINLVAKKTDKKIKGIGIGAPGLINIKKGTVENPPNLPGWDRIHLGKILEKDTGYKVKVENDANAAAIGELIFGAGKGLEYFVMVTLGTGVGGGIVIDGKLYRGANGAGGEVGHVSIDYNGDKCNCGSLGCIEAYAGNNYLNRMVKKELGDKTDSLLYKWVEEDKKELSPKLIYESMVQGDEYSKEVIVRSGKALGYGIASIVNLLDIRDIIVGGGVAGFGETLFDAMKIAIDERVLTPHKENVNIIAAHLKNDAGIQGASALVFYKY